MGEEIQLVAITEDGNLVTTSDYDDLEAGSGAVHGFDDDEGNDTSPLLTSNTDEEEHNEKDTVTATINKEKWNPDGIVWCSASASDASRRGGVLIRKIIKGKPAEQTLLRPGMRLVSLNGVDYSNSSVEDVVDYLMSYDDEVVIVARKSTSTLPPPPQSEEKQPVISVVNAVAVPTTKRPTAKPPSTKRATHLSSSRLPPLSVRDKSGVWGTNTHCGGSTCCWGCVVCLFCGLLPAVICCCIPHDKRPAYKTRGGAIYDEDGALLGSYGDTDFVEEPYLVGDINKKEFNRAANAVCCVVFVVFWLYLILQANSMYT